MPRRRTRHASGQSPVPGVPQRVKSCTNTTFVHDLQSCRGRLRLAVLGGCFGVRGIPDVVTADSVVSKPSKPYPNTMDAIGTCKAPPLPPQLRRRHRRPGRPGVEATDPRKGRPGDEMAADLGAPWLQLASADVLDTLRTHNASPPPRSRSGTDRRVDASDAHVRGGDRQVGRAARTTLRWRTQRPLAANRIRGRPGHARIVQNIAAAAAAVPALMDAFAAPAHVRADRRGAVSCFCRLRTKAPRHRVPRYANTIPGPREEKYPSSWSLQTSAQTAVPSSFQTPCRSDASEGQGRTRCVSSPEGGSLVALRCSDCEYLARTARERMVSPRQRCGEPPTSTLPVSTTDVSTPHTQLPENASALRRPAGICRFSANRPEY